jgi:hypothetical protein
MAPTYRSGRSPGYWRSTRWSSSLESPRPADSRALLGTVMKATRSRRLSSLRRLALPIGRSGRSFTPTFSRSIRHVAAAAGHRAFGPETR